MFCLTVLSLEGISWSQRDLYCRNDQPPPTAFNRNAYIQLDCVVSIDKCLRLMFVQFLGYFIVAIYINNIVSNADSGRKPFYYFLQRRYWWPSKAMSSSVSLNVTDVSCFQIRDAHDLKWAAAQPVEESCGLEIDSDVLKERDKMRLRCKKRIREMDPRL